MCVHVCVCLCRPLQLRARVSMLLVMFSWICKIKLRSRVMPIVLLTWNAIAAFSEEHVAKLVYRVLLLYLVLSSALER